MRAARRGEVVLVKGLGRRHAARHLQAYSRPRPRPPSSRPRPADHHLRPCPCCPCPRRRQQPAAGAPPPRLRQVRCVSGCGPAIRPLAFITCAESARAGAEASPSLSRGWQRFAPPSGTQPQPPARGLAWPFFLAPSARCARRREGVAALEQPEEFTQAAPRPNSLNRARMGGWGKRNTSGLVGLTGRKVPANATSCAAVFMRERCKASFGSEVWRLPRSPCPCHSSSL